MSKFLIDTSIIIDYLRKHQPTIQLLDRLFQKGHQLYISVLTQAELYSGLSTRKHRIRRSLAFLIISFKKIPVNEEVAINGGCLARDSEVDLLTRLLLLLQLKIE